MIRKKNWTNAITRAVYRAIFDDWGRANAATVKADVVHRLARYWVKAYGEWAAQRLAEQLRTDLWAWCEACHETPEADLEWPLQAAGLRQVDWLQIAERLLLQFAGKPLPGEPPAEKLAGPLCLYPFPRPPEEPRS